MESIRRRPSMLALLCSICLLTAGVASAAPLVKPSLSGLKARVAEGGKVDLAASRLGIVELARLRPDYETLKPRARTNAE